MQFPEVRRKDREITDPDEMLQIISRADYGFLSTSASANGYPYGVAVNFFLHDGRVYFHCARGAGVKFKNISRDPRVCFFLVGHAEVLAKKFTSDYESVMIFGRASEVMPDDARQTLLEKLVEHYLQDEYPENRERAQKYIASMFGRTAVYEISIDHMTAKAKRSPPQKEPPGEKETK